MSFSSQRAVYSLINSAILILVANWLYKTPAVLKRQQFKDNASDEIELRGSKYQQLDSCDNEKEEGLDKFEGQSEGEDIRYVPFPFVAPPQKESNHPTDMSERTRSLNHLLCIPKIG